MVGYTPGPWRLCRREDEDEATLVIHVGERHDHLVCETNVNWRNKERNAANARLISAAPELFDLMERASEADSLDEDVRTTWWEERSKALSKAKGE